MEDGSVERLSRVRMKNVVVAHDPFYPAGFVQVMGVWRQTDQETRGQRDRREHEERQAREARHRRQREEAAGRYPPPPDAREEENAWANFDPHEPPHVEPEPKKAAADPYWSICPKCGVRSRVGEGCQNPMCGATRQPDINFDDFFASFFRHRQPSYGRRPAYGDPQSYTPPGARPPPPRGEWMSILERPSNRKEAEKNYRRLTKVRHPDRPGGSNEKMAELNAAIAQARRHFG